MNNRVFLEHLVQTHHRELMQEARSWRQISLANGKQPARVGLVQRIRKQVGKLPLAPANIASPSLTHES
jgi:hypothetical protein